MKKYSCSNNHQISLMTLLSCMAALCMLFTSCGVSGASTAPPKPVHNLAPIAVALPKDAAVVSDDIFNAIDAGDIETVKTHIKGGMAVDSVDSNGTTPLMWASTQGQLEIMRYLIDQGASINKGRYSDQITPLIAATLYEQPDAIRLLLEKGAEIDLSANQSNALYQAANVGYTEVVDVLLEAGANPNLFTSSGFDPLFAALSSSQLQIVKSLIDHHADVNAVYSPEQPYPNSPLMVAAWRGNPEIIKTLLESGARDPWLSGVQGFDPNHFAPLDVSLVDGKILVSGASQPLFLGASFAKRPWVDPSSIPPDTTGTNFFTWTDSSTHTEVMILIISDQTDHKTQLSAMLPIFIADKGIIYAGGVSEIVDKGPFVTLRVHTENGIQGKIVLIRGKDSIEKVVDATGLTVFNLVKVDQQNEPLTVKIFNESYELAEIFKNLYAN